MSASKYEEKMPVVLQNLSNGYNMTEAARKAGISKDTLYEWMKQHPDFSDAVQYARREGEQKAIHDVELALLDLAKGKDWEEVISEYAAAPNPKYDPDDPTSGEPIIPVIKKQRRFRKHIPPSVEAIKFYLTNKAPDQWKNRQEHDIPNLDILRNLRVERSGNSSSEGLELNPTEI